MFLNNNNENLLPSSLHHGVCFHVKKERKRKGSYRQNHVTYNRNMNYVFGFPSCNFYGCLSLLIEVITLQSSRYKLLSKGAARDPNIKSKSYWSPSYTPNPTGSLRLCTPTGQMSQPVHGP